MEILTFGRSPHWETPLLSASDLAAFRHDGFLTIRQIVDPTSVAATRARIVDLFENRTGREEGAFFDFAGNDDDDAAMTLPQLIDVRNYAPELTASVFYKNALAVARELLGPEAKFVADHALAKPARHGAITPWHQDDAFREGFYAHNEISVWLALQDTDASNGCLSFVRGSHLKPVLPHRSYGGNERVHALECFDGWTPDQVELCPLRAGDCTVHTNRTLHGAGPNTSPDPRYGYVLVFGTPPNKLPAPLFHPWLRNKQEARLERRRAWLMRGGAIVHGWRRLRQARQIGYKEFMRRLLSHIS